MDHAVKRGSTVGNPVALRHQRRMCPPVLVVEALDTRSSENRTSLRDLALCERRVAAWGLASTILTALALPNILMEQIGISCEVFGVLVWRPVDVTHHCHRACSWLSTRPYVLLGLGGTTLRIAMIGTRGVPAAYGGFETAVEEISRRLVDHGHEVVVYTRGSSRHDRTYLGIRVVHLPAVPQKQLETLSHTGLSTLHAAFRLQPDVAFVFNAANAPFLPILRLRKIPTALHMDGLEWKRAKWGQRGRAYYRWAEEFGVGHADALIADAPGIAEYYSHQFGVPTELIRYGAPVLEYPPGRTLEGLGLEPDGYHLVVARFEPENHVLDILQGYQKSASSRPLVVVGAAPYAADYTRAIQRVAGTDKRIRLLGAVYDQDLLDALYFNAHTYIHGHSVGGTNPSLLRAMGAGTAVVAYDVVFNKEVLDGQGWYFSGPAEVSAALNEIEHQAMKVRRMGELGKLRAGSSFSWEAVAGSYEALASRLVQGQTIRSTSVRPRRTSVEWSG